MVIIVPPYNKVKIKQEINGKKKSLRIEVTRASI